MSYPHYATGGRNVRFWDFINGSPVKLTLRPGQKLHHYQAAPTDEGWHSNAHSWEYVHPDGIVLVEYESDGVDCDGRLSSGGTRWFYDYEADAGYCPDDEDHCYPRWQADEYWRRDWQAEAAGY